MPEREASIPYAKSRILQNKVDAIQYKRYLQEHPNVKATDDLKCVQCGGEIILCEGDINRPYFKHIPDSEGHNCPLYTGGAYTKSHELVAKLIEEDDISFKFELLYRFDKWKTVLVLPSFTDEEIRKFASNNTYLKIKINNKESTFQELYINEENFSSDKIQTFSFGEIAHSIAIEVKGKDGSRVEINKFFKGFNPDEQIYQCLSDFDYNSSNNIIDLTNFKHLVFRKTSGKIYLGRHYVVFVNNRICNNKIITFLKIGNSATIRTLKLKSYPKDNYFAYDVVFNEINDETKKFCERRSCELSEDYCADIVWPPVNMLGNTKSILLDDKPQKHFKQLFVLFGNNQSSYELLDYQRPNCKEFMRIHNTMSKPFYLNSKSFEHIELKPFEMTSEDTNEFNSSKNVFRFKNGVLMNKVTENTTIKVSNDENYLDLEYRLSIKMLFNSKQEKDESLLNLIRYSIEYETFTENEYNAIKDKNSNNETLMEYIDFCIEVKQIKKGIKEKYM